MSFKQWFFRLSICCRIPVVLAVVTVISMVSCSTANADNNSAYVGYDFISENVFGGVCNEDTCLNYNNAHKTLSIAGNVDIGRLHFEPGIGYDFDNNIAVASLYSAIRFNEGSGVELGGNLYLTNTTETFNYGLSYRGFNSHEESAAIVEPPVDPPCYDKGSHHERHCSFYSCC